MINETISKLIAYAKIHLALSKLDEVYVTNELLDLLNLTDFTFEEVNLEQIEKMTVPDEILKEIAKFALENNCTTEEFLEHFLTKNMSIVCQKPSEVEREFWNRYKEKKSLATDYLYDLSIKNNYIQKTAVEKNKWWEAKFENGENLEITINLSKPEKKNSDIAKILSQQSTNYPKCVLCYENVGFKGNLKKAPRQTLRTIDLKLNGEDWFMQYSPYVYFDEHCIVINKEHKSMSINDTTFAKLMDFVDMFPHYFIGSNACLPIVGGSILNHEHYQGGLHLMPLHHSNDKFVFIHEKFKDVKISILNWYNSCIRLVSKNREQILALANNVWEVFENYTDKDNYIFSQTDGEKHNTITPLVRKVDEDYVIEIILRNNITSEEHPDGVFHAHKQYHDVKSEGIGLIEAMGLFILPPRVKKCLETEENFTVEHINQTCQNILKNTAIFKDDEKGINGFKKFMQAVNFKEVK